MGGGAVSRTSLDGPGLGRQRLGAGFGERVNVSAAAVHVPASSLLLVWVLRRGLAALVWLVRHSLVLLGASVGYWLLLVTQNLGPAPSSPWPGCSGSGSSSGVCSPQPRSRGWSWAGLVAAGGRWPCTGAAGSPRPSPPGCR